MIYRLCPLSLRMCLILGREPVPDDQEDSLDLDLVDTDAVLREK